LIGDTTTTPQRGLSEETREAAWAISLFVDENPATWEEIADEFEGVWSASTLRRGLNALRDAGMVEHSRAGARWRSKAPPLRGCATVQRAIEGSLADDLWPRRMLLEAVRKLVGERSDSEHRLPAVEGGHG
jgi:hypothetical protein